MNVVVSLTRMELLEILSKHFGNVKIDDYKIFDPNRKRRVIVDLEKGLTNSLNVAVFNPAPENKIACIKALREQSINFSKSNTMIGLWEAKTAIENWSAFKKFVTSHNRFPNNYGAVFS